MKQQDQVAGKTITTIQDHSFDANSNEQKNNDIKDWKHSMNQQPIHDLLLKMLKKLYHKQ